jgi:hypothetical protein
MNHVAFLTIFLYSISKLILQKFQATLSSRFNLFSLYLSYVGVIWFLLIKPLYMIGMCFSEDQRANLMKTHIQKRLDYIIKFYLPLYTQ